MQTEELVITAFASCRGASSAQGMSGIATSLSALESCVMATQSGLMKQMLLLANLKDQLSPPPLLTTRLSLSLPVLSLLQGYFSESLLISFTNFCLTPYPSMYPLQLYADGNRHRRHCDLDINRCSDTLNKYLHTFSYQVLICTLGLDLQPFARTKLLT